MKTIIAGSRTFSDYDLLCTVLSDLDWEITEVVSGTARGADQLGEKWANLNKIPVIKFPAEWDLYGKSAGPMRNSKMAKYVGSKGALVAFWDQKSRGTLNMIEIARKLGLKVKVIDV